MRLELRLMVIFSLNKKAPPTHSKEHLITNPYLETHVNDKVNDKINLFGKSFI